MGIMDAEEILSRTSIRIYVGKIMVVTPSLIVHGGIPLDSMGAPVAPAEAYLPNKVFRFLIYLTPALLLGLLAEGAGQILGCAAGRGNCTEKMTRYEFDRLKHAHLM